MDGGMEGGREALTKRSRTQPQSRSHREQRRRTERMDRTREKESREREREQRERERYSRLHSPLNVTQPQQQNTNSLLE